jgi:hypothetical protein
MPELEVTRRTAFVSICPNGTCIIGVVAPSVCHQSSRPSSGVTTPSMNRPQPDVEQRSRADQPQMTTILADRRGAGHRLAICRTLLEVTLLGLAMTLHAR